MTTERHIETERLLLRPLTVEDADDLYLVYSSEAAMRYWDTPPHTAIDQTEAMINRLLTRNARWWSICGPKEHEAHHQWRVIGIAGYIGNPGVPGMGYILHPDYWQQGYMTEAMTAALGYGFQELALDRAELWINDDNLASQRLAQKLGFIRRGRFRQKYRHHDISHDKIVYGLHVSEWRQPANRPVENYHQQFYSLQPVLSVANVKATAEYYRDKLGFRIDFLYGDPPVHGAVARGEWTTESVRIQLSNAGPDEIKNGDSVAHISTALYIFVGPDIDGLFNHYREQGVTIVREATSHPWGMREFDIKDCNGYTLRFGTPV